MAAGRDDYLIKCMNDLKSDMTEIKKDVKEMTAAVSLIAQSHYSLKEKVDSNREFLEEKLDNHINKTFDHKVYIGIIIVLVGMLTGLVSYIWGSEKNESHEKEIHSTN